MAYPIVAKNPQGVTQSSSSTNTASCPAVNTGIGDWIVVIVFYPNAVSSNVPTDTIGNTYKAITSQTDSVPNNDLSLYVCKGSKAANANNVITATVSANSVFLVSICSYNRIRAAGGSNIAQDPGSTQTSGTISQTLVDPTNWIVGGFVAAVLPSASTGTLRDRRNTGTIGGILMDNLNSKAASTSLIATFATSYWGAVSFELRCVQGNIVLID